MAVKIGVVQSLPTLSDIVKNLNQHFTVSNLSRVCVEVSCHQKTEIRNGMHQQKDVSFRLV